MKIRLRKRSRVEKFTLGRQVVSNINQLGIGRHDRVSRWLIKNRVPPESAVIAGYGLAVTKEGYADYKYKKQKTARKQGKSARSGAGL